MIFKVIIADRDIADLDEPDSNLICFSNLTIQELEFLTKIVENQNTMNEFRIRLIAYPRMEE